MNILLTNDDGINAPGLEIMQKIACSFGNTYIIAPEKEHSQCGHSLKIGKAIKIKKIAQNKISIDGSPADCVRLGISKLIFPKIDFVLSGVNRGNNLGIDLYISGTISAAREAAFCDIKSASISQAFEDNCSINWQRSSILLKKSLEFIFKKKKKIKRMRYFNINLPVWNDKKLPKIKKCKPSTEKFAINIKKTDKKDEFIDLSVYDSRKICSKTDVYFCKIKKQIAASLLKIKPA